MSSEDAEFDRHIDGEITALNRQNKLTRRRNMLVVGVAVLALLFGLACLFLAMDNAKLATANKIYGAEQQQEKQSLAEEFDAACQAADFTTTAAGSNICRKAEQVASEPSAPLAGPQGIQGVPGPRGEQGFAGPAGAAGPKGDKGDKGDQGIMGLLGLAGNQGPPGPVGPVGPLGPVGPAGPTGLTGPPGVQGEPGPAGADSTVPGPPGAPGADGATGPQGPVGADGRGISSAFCGDNGRWAVTYTDGAVQDGGQCRTTLPVGNGAP